MMLREVLCGSFCTAVLGTGTAGNFDLHATLAMLRFLSHAGRLTTRVRAPQPALTSLQRRLRALEERLAVEMRDALARRPVQTLRSPPALYTGGTRADAELADSSVARATESLRELAMQLGSIAQQHDYQAARLQAQLRTLRAVISDSGGEQLGLPFSESQSHLGCVGGSHVVVARMDIAEKALCELEVRLNSARSELKRFDQAVLDWALHDDS